MNQTFELETTADKILNTAEHMFAEKGIAAVSLRSIVKLADVNIAAVHYHFGSKEGLVRAVFKRRLSEVNAQRVQALNNLKESYAGKTIPVPELMRAFLTPALALGGDSDGGKDFFRLVARAHAETDPAVCDELCTQLKDIIELYLDELGRSLPDLSFEQRMARLGFVAGAMVQAVLMPLRSQIAESFGGPQLSDVEVFECLIDFCSGGFAAHV